MVEKKQPDIRVVGVMKRLNALSPVPTKKPSLLATIPRFPEEEPQPTEDDKIISRSTKVFEDLFEVVPQQHRVRYFDRLKKETSNHQHIARLKGIIAELQRVKEFQNHPDVERIDFDAEPITVAYPAYHDRDQWFEIQNPQGEKAKKPKRIVKNGQVEIDVPIRVKRDPDKPYVYEVKEARGVIYGSHPIKRLNQLLKYNAAVEQGLASGATVEIRGRIGTSMLKWFLLGKDLIPNVQVVHTINLPSGKRYRMVLKPAQNPLLDVASKDESFKHEGDSKVIAGLKRAFNMKDKSLFIRNMTQLKFDDFPNLDFDLHAPERIEDQAEMVRYQVAISNKIWERFTAIAEWPTTNEIKTTPKLMALAQLTRAVYHAGVSRTNQVLERIRKSLK